jgi:ABC-type multidrug transport system fused ATPase/permease subunit
MLLYISVEMTIICLILAAVTMYFLNYLVLRSEKLANTMIDTNTKLNEFITERFGLLKLVKIFSAEDIESQKFQKGTARYADQNTAFVVNGIKIETVFQITIFSIAICILYVATFVFQIELALLLVFIFILIRLTDPLRQLNSQRHLIAGEGASLGMIDKILNDTKAAQTIKDGEKKFTGFKKSILFEKVCFSYTPQSETIQEISLEIKKNEMVALVGASGGGKSTIVDLLIRVIEPDRGRILIDDVNLMEFNIESYHKKIGFVSQESFLFNDSVINNICYGSSECKIDKVIACAQIANAHEFVLQLPLGYDTELGERGVKLSGGEKQRIALARALYHDPEILILDEATSALDSESEKIIQESINKIKHKYTIIAIAHRLSTIENSDSIIVIDKGRVVETGIHNELIKSGGIYSKFYEIQYGTTNSVKRNDDFSKHYREVPMPKEDT